MRKALATRGRKRFAATGALLVTATVLSTVLAGVFSEGGERSSRAATSATATTEIRRQDLVEVETEQGTQGYGDERAVINRLSGTVTWLPAEGSVVPPDRVLYRVDAEPVILLDGRVPAYRDLGLAVGDGADVAQLERNLRALGYDESRLIDLDDSWDSGTTAAVERWQQAHSLDQTGVIDLGTVVFQPGKRRVASLDATLGGDAAGGRPAGAGEEGASIQGTGAQTSFASYSIPPSAPETGADDPEDELRGQRETQEAEPEEGPPDSGRDGSDRRQAPREPPAPQQQRAPAQAPPSDGGPPRLPPVPPAVADAKGPSSGAAGAAEGPTVSSAVMTTTSTRPVVTVDLDTSKIALATRRTRVEVELPSGDDVRGRITDVGSVAAAPAAEQGAEPTASIDATVELTIRLRASRRFLDQAPVVVTLERSRRRNVLAVPVTALLARDRGEFAVEVRDGPRRRLVSVQPGLYAGGFVEVSGQGLRAGMVVTDARV